MRITRDFHACVHSLIFMLAATAVYAQSTKTAVYGATSVTLSSDFLSGLTALGLNAGTVFPSRLNHGVATFPIAAGAIDLDTAAGEIIHSGGLTLENEKWDESQETNVSLQSFTIDTTNPKAHVLTGLVVVNDKLLGRLPLFNLVFPNGLTLPLKTEGGVVLKLDDVGLTLTSTAASALDTVFGTKALSGGLDIGRANVFALVVGTPEN